MDTGIKILKKLLILFLLLPSLAWGSDLGQDYARMNPYILGGGASAAAAPEWVEEIASRVTSTSSATTTVITLSSAVSQNNRVIVAVNWASATQTVSGIADSRSNTYSKMEGRNMGGTRNSEIWTANAGTALQVGDTITITWADAAYTYRWAAAFSITGANTTTQPDQTCSNASAYAQTVACTASTTAAATVIFGIIMCNDKTYSSGSWTTIGDVHTSGDGRNAYYVRTTETSSGSKNPGGSISAYDWYGAIWAAFK